MQLNDEQIIKYIIINWLSEYKVIDCTAAVLHGK